MADATDLKSVDRKVVWVRLPPSAPTFNAFGDYALHQINVHHFTSLIWTVE
jgi:hypothetical protein